MKQIFLYLFLVLLVIVLLAVVNRKAEIPQPVLGQKNQGQAYLLPGEPTINFGHAYSLIVTPGVTRIKKSPKKEAAQEEGAKEKQKLPEASLLKPASISSSQNVSSQSKGISGQAEKPETGVTKIGKTPTEKENNELNQQGIIMY